VEVTKLYASRNPLLVKTKTGELARDHDPLRDGIAGDLSGLRLRLPEECPEDLLLVLR